MGKVMSYKGVWPTLHETVFMTDGAFVIGDVHIGASSISPAFDFNKIL